MDTRLASVRNSEFAAAHSTASRAPDHVRRVTLAVRGLYYEHCEIGLAYQLHGSAGIVDVVVDSRAGTAAITFDARRLSEKAVGRLVSECGYEVAGRAAAGTDAAHAADAVDAREGRRSAGAE